MPNINLLPWREIERKKKTQSFIASIVLAALLAVILIGLTYFYIWQKIEDADYRLRVLDQNIAEMDDAIKEIKHLKDFQGDLKKQLKAIDAIQNQRLTALSTLEEISNKSMRNLRIDRVETEADKIFISGAGYSTKDIANYIRKLEKSEVFDNPDLSNEGIQRREQKGDTIEDNYAYDFTVEATLKNIVVDNTGKKKGRRR